MRGQRGQGTIEYVAVVLVVAAVLAAAIALLAGTGLGERVVDAFRRALCVVTGGPCGAWEAGVESPCVRRADQHVDHGHLTLVVVRIGSEDVVLREQLADGRVRLTLVDRKEAGLETGVGAGAQVRWGTRTYAAGAETRAAALAELSSGRAWIAADPAAADRLLVRIRLAALSHRAKPTIAHAPEMAPNRTEVDAPDPDVTFSEHAGVLSLHDQLGRQRGADLAAAIAYGERIDHATGRRTVYARASAAAGGRIALGRGAGVAADARNAERYGVTYDRAGRPIDLEVLSTLDVDGAAGLPRPLAQAAGLLSIPLRGGRHVEIEQHLDLTDPENAALAARFLDGAGVRDAAGAARALAQRLDEQGSMAVRTYTTSEQAHEVRADGRLGVALGIGGGSEDSSAQLLAAVRRGAGGRFAADAACLPLAA